jgi:hypothetical protein
MDTLTPEQTVELDQMFHQCGFPSQDWIDIPAWLYFQATVASGAYLAGQKQSVGSAQGADFYLRRVQLLNNVASGSDGSKVWMKIKMPSGRYLQTGLPVQPGSISGSAGIAGTFTPGPSGLIKPEVHCPAGSQITIDLLNVTPTYALLGGVSVTISIVFVGVYRYRLRRECAA